MRTWPVHLLIAGAVLAASVVLRIADPAPIARLRAAVFDAYVAAVPRSPDTAVPVRVVAIDEASLAAEGQWPWPRTKLAQLVTALSSAGARSITFDLLLAEPDRLSPDALMRSLPNSADAKSLVAALAHLPSNDAALARAISAAPVVLGVVGDDAGNRKIADARASFAFAGDDPASAVPSFAGGIESLPELAQAAKGIGALNWLPSGDGVVRRVPLLISIAGKLYPSLVVEALRVGAGEPSIFIKSAGGSGVEAFGEKTGIDSVRVAGHVVPVDAGGEMWFYPARSQEKRNISARDVLAGTVPESEIAGRHIIIGATTAGLLDLRASALEAAVPGVEIHAQAMEQILSGGFLTRPGYATGAELLFLIGIGGALAFFISRSGALVAAGVGGASAALVAALSWFGFTRAGVLFDPVYPIAAVTVTYLATSLASYVQSELERGRIRSAFGHYLTPALIDDIAASREPLRLGGQAREMTLLFADVRGFSRLSEGMSAEALVAFINSLMTPFADIILAHRGTVDKYMGDAVMAFWNAPLRDEDHARNACKAALALRAALAGLNDRLGQEARQAGKGFVPIRVGIGINTGSCVVGNVGSPQRFDYSVMGDAVNTASRLEETTKARGADIIIGEATAREVADFAVLELGRITPRGKDRPERIFALIGDCELAASPAFEALKTVHASLLAAEARGEAKAVAEALAASSSAARLLSAGQSIAAGLYNAWPCHAPTTQST